MSLVVIQIGQCGNQIGFNFFNSLSNYIHQKINNEINKIVKNNKNINNNYNNNDSNKENKVNNSCNANRPSTGSSNDKTINIDNVTIEKIYAKLHKQYQRFFDMTRIKQQPTKGESYIYNYNKKKYILPKLRARAILVDSEVKVIKSIVEKTKEKSWKYDENNIYHEQIGAANNWSFGYYIHGPKAYEAVKQRIRTEVENCMDFDAFLIIQSLAGGTGSGLGSYFTEKLRKDYPYSTILNLAVWPYQTGEVVVQNYNIVLSIAHLYKYTDAIMLIYNSELHSICSTRLNYKTVSFQHINTLISDTLVNIFINKKPLPNPYSSVNPLLSPVESLWIRHATRNFSFLSRQTLLQKRSSRVTMRQLIDQLCPIPNYKILSIKFVPQTSAMAEQFNITNWNGLLRSLSQMALTDRSLDEKLNWSISMKKPYHEQTNPYIHFIGNILILRGKDISPSSSSSSSSLSSSSSTLPSTTTALPVKQKANSKKSYPTKIKNEDGEDRKELNEKFNQLKLYNNNNTNNNNNNNNNNKNVQNNDNPSIILASKPYFNYDYPITAFDTKLYTYYSNDTYKYSQSAYLISNSTSIIPKLEEVIEKVARMYTTKAYIYQYNKYGLTNEHFERIMLEIEQILFDYKKLLPR